ncbi:hypothetical protein BD560DRAFT_311739, partial [Blakeslea trispora]
PRLLDKASYQDCLLQHLPSFLSDASNSGCTPQGQWDMIKANIKRITKRFSLRLATERKHELKQLMKERNSFLRSKPSIEVRNSQLPIYDKAIAALQEDTSATLALRANVRWREKGETSIKYLRHMVRHRSNTQQMTALRTSPDETANSDLHSMLHTSQQFYTGLYSTDPVEETDLDSYLTD